MMLESGVMTFVGGALSVVGLRVIYHSLCRFSSRTANDVYPFLIKIDMEALYGTFHPEAEESLRQSMSPLEFKKMQWKRLHLAIHYCNLLSHNTQIFVSWTKYERKKSWKSMSASLQKIVQELRIGSLQCRLSVFVIRARLRWWVIRIQLIPFAPPPSFDDLLYLGSGDMIAFYETAAALAEAFSLAYGEEFHAKLVQAL